MGASSTAAGWLLVLSPIGPVGIVRSVEPSPGRELSAWVWAAALGLGGACVAVAVLLTARSARRVSQGRTSTSTSPPAPRTVGTVQRLLPGRSRPEVAEGVRAACRGGQGAGLLIATGTIALTVVVTVVVFGASLTSVVTQPPAYGWPWDVAMMGGAGHGGVDLDAARAALDARPDVAGWTALGLTNGVVDGEPIPSVVTYDDVSTVEVTLVSGRLPAGSRQVALAARTAQDLGVGVGDKVDLAGEGVQAGRATVTAIVVLPALGAYISDRAGPGTGALIPSAALDVDLAPGMVTFLGIDVAADADPKAVERDLHDDFATWDRLGFRTFDYATPVRPPRSSTRTPCGPSPYWWASSSA